MENGSENRIQDGVATQPIDVTMNGEDELEFEDNPDADSVEERQVRKAKRLLTRQTSGGDSSSNNNAQVNKKLLVLSKNSRKSRDGRGRGLPKKAQGTETFFLQRTHTNCVPVLQGTETFVKGQDTLTSYSASGIISVAIPTSLGDRSERNALESADPSVPPTFNGEVMVLDRGGQTVSPDTDDMQPLMSSTLIYTEDKEPKESNVDGQGITGSNKTAKEPSRRPKGLRKMGRPQGTGQTKRAAPTEGGALWEEFVKSEVERHKSDIERNKSDIERNKSDIERNKSEIELINAKRRLYKLQEEKLMLELNLLTENKQGITFLWCAVGC